MKIRNPLLIRVLAPVAAAVVRFWIGTTRYHVSVQSEDTLPKLGRVQARYIYAFWHENMLQPAVRYCNLGIHVLISQHADGQKIAAVCRLLGFRPVFGSSTRGGVEAVRRLLRASADGILAVTPDGPRGPRRQVQMGLIYLAARTGLPVVGIGFGADRPWRTKSWDRFAVPRPFSRCACVATAPITVPSGLDKVQLEQYRKKVEDALRDATAAAERWAATGVAPEASVALTFSTIDERLSHSQAA